jgi:hypothetical protein
VACFALEHGMGAKQRETVLMLLYGLHSDPPAFDGVAFVALGSELPAMDIGVAIGTLRSYVGEYQLCMAKPALNGLVETTQWIARFMVVIEFGDASQGAPTCRGVATSARNGQVSMRAPRRTALEGLRKS